MMALWQNKKAGFPAFFIGSEIMLLPRGAEHYPGR